MFKQEQAAHNDITLITRRALSDLLKMGISSIDLIPEDKLPKVRLGRSVRYRLSSVRKFIDENEKSGDYKGE